MLRLLAEYAPDLFDWNSGVYEFPAPKPLLDSVVAETLAETSSFASLNAARKQERIALLRSLEQQPLLAPADIHRVVPRRTWLRRRAEARLARDEFDGLYRLVRTQALAELVFGDAERARAWLHSPKERLGGRAPMACATDTLGFEAVQAWLHEIDQGWLA